MAPVGPVSKEVAIANYNSKVRSKTNSGDYRLVEMNYDDEVTDEKK